MCINANGAGAQGSAAYVCISLSLLHSFKSHASWHGPHTKMDISYGRWFYVWTGRIHSHEIVIKWIAPCTPIAIILLACKSTNQMAQNA